MSNVHINNFGNNYGFYQNNNSSKPQVEKEAKEEAIVAPKHEAVEANEIMSAMSIMGAQNLAHVTAKNQVNPADYLSAERIASIEDSMKLFEQGVEKYAGAVQEEFGDIFSDETVYALAAEAFSKE